MNTPTEMKTSRIRTATDRGRWVPATLILGAFTPYLGIGLDVRLEHLLAYGAAGIIIVNGRLSSRRTLLFARPILLPWLVLALLVLLSTGLRISTETGNWPTVRLLAIADSFLLPVALVLVGGAYAARQPTAWKRQIRRISSLLIALVSLNSLLILRFPVGQIESFVRQFWANPTTAVGPVKTVAELALQGGRYGGIFNQPFDGGLAYALALMGWAYLFLISPRPRLYRKIAALLSLALVIAGGVSTGSKVFVYGGVLVVGAALYAPARGQQSRMRRLTRGGIFVAVGVSAVVILELAAFNKYLQNLTAFGTDAEAFSGGRWLSVREYIDSLFRDLSLTGVGWYTANDDALLSYLQGGGVLGVIAFIAVCVGLFRTISGLKHADAERVLIIGMTVIVLAASLGAISLQVNRASSIYWIYVGLAVGSAAAQASMPRLQRGHPSRQG